MIHEPMLPPTFGFEWDGMDERGARTVNVWCNQCPSVSSGVDASEATTWAQEHVHYECPFCGHMLGGMGSDGERFTPDDEEAFDQHMARCAGGF